MSGVLQVSPAKPPRLPRVSTAPQPGHSPGLPGVSVRSLRRASPGLRRASPGLRRGFTGSRPRLWGGLDRGATQTLSGSLGGTRPVFTRPQPGLNRVSTGSQPGLNRVSTGSQLGLPEGLHRVLGVDSFSVLIELFHLTIFFHSFFFSFFFLSNFKERHFCS